MTVRWNGGSDVGASTASLSTKIGARRAGRKSVWMSPFSSPSPPALDENEEYLLCAEIVDVSGQGALMIRFVSEYGGILFFWLFCNCYSYDHH